MERMEKASVKTIKAAFPLLRFAIALAYGLRFNGGARSQYMSADRYLRKFRADLDREGDPTGFLDEEDPYNAESFDPDYKIGTAGR